MRTGVLLLERLAVWTLVAGLMSRNGGPLAEAWGYLCLTMVFAALFVISVLLTEILGRAIEWTRHQWFHVK